MNSSEARARFEDARVAHLATVGADGGPHVVPITFALDRDTIITAVDAKPKRHAQLKRIANIRANPRVTVLIDHYDDDWAMLWWARADGVGRVVTDGLEFDRAAALLRTRYRQYSRTVLTGPVILIEVARWAGWSAS
ncbi:MAG TPA: TIGR03668 family PPOX class F420-dependent oxidoreductase [Candidatus Limnocylindria bacterium]